MTGENGLQDFINKTADLGAAGPEGPSAKAPATDLDRWLLQDDEAAKLKLSVQQGAARNPDTATRLLQMQTKTGLPKDYLERNLDDVEAEVRQQSFDVDTFRKTSPSFAGWLSQHPDHPAAARQDLTRLNYLERQLRYIGANKEIGELQDELMGIGEQAMNDTAGPPVRARQVAIEKRLKELEAFNAGTDITGFVEQIPGVAVQQWPVNKRVIGGMAEGATKGLVIGAAGGAAVGGPAGAVAGGLTMLGPAALVGGGLEAGKAEMHAAFVDYEKLKDENGQPLDRTTIKGLALMAGAANGTLEMLFGLEPVMLKVPGVRGLTRHGLTELLKTPTTRDALLRFGRSLGTVMVEEGVTEAMQMYVTKLAGAIGQTMQDGGSILDRVLTGENFGQAVQEARAGAQGGGGMALPMVSATAAADLRRVKEAQRTQQAFENVGAVAASTKLREALPGTLRSIIDSALKEGPIETLYLPIDTFSTYFQSKGADPRDVAAALTGSPEDYDQAVASGGDLAVKTADYAEKIAGTEHNAFFARELRPSLAAMNAREADEWIAEQVNQDVLPGVQTAAVDDPAARVRQEIAGQLEALGFDPAVVDNYAQLYQSRYQARAERRGLGEDAFDLFRKVGLTIQRVLPEILKKVGGTTTEMDALLDRLRAGDVPKPGEIFGQSLVEALRELGLQEVGEVTALDPDQGRQPFQKKLVREDGLSLDQAAERMHEAGYLQERSIEQLLEGLRQELAGTPIYVPGAENALLLDVSRKLEDLQHYLTEQGVDLTATPNEQIKAMFERLVSTEEVPAIGQDPASDEGETFEQGDAIVVDGVARPTANSEGVPIARTRDGLEKFWRWFQNSKVVDVQGRPLVVYHGTRQTFDAFQPDSHFGTKGQAEEAPRYADHADGGAPRVMPVYLSIQNPQRTEDVGEHEQWAEVIDQAKHAGHDGIVYVNTEEMDDAFLAANMDDPDAALPFPDSWIAFWPEQIKSAGKNSGEFDTRNPSIYFQDPPDAPTAAGKLTLLQEAVRAVAAGAEEGIAYGLRPDLEALGGSSDVAIVWGHARMGLEKIGRKRGVEVVWKVLRAVALGSIERYSATKKTVVLQHRGAHAVLSLDEHGQQKTWLLTGWEEGRPDVPGEVRTPSGTTQHAPTFSRDVLGAGLTTNLSLSAERSNGPSPFFQSGAKDAKGQITFGSGRIDIALLEKADLSTFIHETGHLYLNELIEDALTPGVPQQLRDDLDSILGWMGLAVLVTDGADAIKSAIGRDQHELFARGFEAYALEGKSPSLAMREVFARFRQWLIQVYRLISYRGEAADAARVGSALQVTLTPEVRKVMNRMVATEEEIQAMESEAAVDPMFTDAEAAGMTPAEFSRYQEHVTQAGYLAREALQSQVLAQLARERTDWWKAKATEMRTEVLAEANQRPVYVALSVLQEGTMPDGSALPEGLVAGKLSKKAIAAVFGRAFVGQLPRGTTIASGGMTPDHAAWLFGYASGEELLTDLANVRNKQELVEAETHLRMTREYGDPLIDGTLHEKARTAVLNAEREQVIEAEMVAIDKKRREITQGALAGLMPPPESVRKLAKAQIARQRIREIHPQAHFLAAQRANKAASEALWKRDYLAAGLAKQKEFLNLALYREATAAREEVERVVQHLRELRTKSKQEKIGKAGSDYLEQINAIMERYEFSPVPHTTLAKRQALREWIAEKEHEGETLGEEFVVPEEILFEARKMNYKELPFEELEGIRDTIAQIEHFARAKNRLLAEQAIQDKEEARTLLINQLLANTPGRPPQALTESSMTRGEKMSRLAERYHASLLKTEQLMDELDGGTEGPWHDYFWNPAVDAQAAEADYTERITGKIAEAVVNIPASIRKRMLELVAVPGMPRPMSRKEIIGAALNVGNPSNQAKLMKGMAWSDRNLAEMLDHLTKEEWDFVQKVWDTLESMWPDIVVLQKKLTGVAPEKVKVEPVQTKFGTYAGGYYPVMYAAALSAQGALQLSSTFGKLLDDNYVKATLPSGYRKGRIDEFAAPFDLDVDRLPSHIAGVVKDLTHRAWLIDANWIVSDKRIRAALKERLGEALTLRLADWVGQVANDRAGGSSKSLSVWMQMLESFRMNTVIVAMGFKFSTMASQISGVAPAIETLGRKDGGGVKWFSVGVSEALRRPQSTYDFMVAKSGEMRHRITSRDRDLRDKLRALQGRKDLVAQLQEVSLMGIGYMELMVSMPTWIGGYRQALDAGKTDEQAVRAGDRAVRLSQGAAGAKDLAAVAGRSDTMMRLLTMFYTPFSALYNRLRSIGHDVEGIGDLPRAAVRLWLTVTVAATLGELLAGHGPDKDEPWWRWWVRVQAMYPFLAVPLLRDAISTLASGYGYQFSPIAQALETGTRFTRSAVKAAAGEKEWEELAAQAVKVFSYFVGLPTSQLVITAKYLHDLNAGSEHPDDLFEFTKKLLYARPKEN